MHVLRLKRRASVPAATEAFTPALPPRGGNGRGPAIVPALTPYPPKKAFSPFCHPQATDSSFQPKRRAGALSHYPLTLIPESAVGAHHMPVGHEHRLLALYHHQPSLTIEAVDREVQRVLQCDDACRERQGHRPP